MSRLNEAIKRIAALALPCLLTSCADPSGTAAANARPSFKPCTVVRYMGPRYAVLELRVRERAETVKDNVVSGSREDGFIRLAEGAYLSDDWSVVEISQC